VGARAADPKVDTHAASFNPRTTASPVVNPTADIPVETAEFAADPPTSTAGGPGRRRAVKPTRADRAAVRHAERQAAKLEAAREAKAVKDAAVRAAETARAARKQEASAARERARQAERAAAATATSRPEPRTGHHTGGRGRKSLIPGLPSAPSLIGAAALAFAGVGATVSQQTTTLADDDFQKFATQASVLNAASSIGSSDAISGRQRAVSRDSERQALQDAADAELQEAAETQAKERSAALAALAASAEKHANQIAKNAWQLPLPAGSYRVSNNFGHCSYLWVNCHTGEDLSAPSGTPIYSVASGTVTEAGYDGSYGNKTVVTLEDGTEIWYCHQTTMGVSVGETLTPGQTIGTVGSTGNTTGPHLHIEVHPGAGDAVDPVSALAVRGITL
jgi:murein DD-endopeptidase MepM/ murein hydrolase activator NlpD